MASVTVDVELDEFDLDEILNELEHRYNGNRRGNSDKNVIDKFIKKMKFDFEEVIPLNNLSLLDKMKIDFVVHNLDNITLNDLEKLTNK